MKTAIVFSLLIMPFVCTPVAQAQDQPPICGDVNASDSLSTADALAVLRKAVGQSVDLDCSGYEGQIAGCETALAECLGGGSTCGDDVLNVAGEHCDGTDLGGAECSTLGFGGGTLACTSACTFDASGCEPISCPEGAVPFRGACWLLAAQPLEENVGSCDTACASVGLTCDEPSLQAVGSHGTNEDCRAALDVVHPAGAPHTISPFSPEDVSFCGSAADYASGCVLFVNDENYAFRNTYEGSGTTCSADLRGGGCTTGTPRACACNP